MYQFISEIPESKQWVVVEHIDKGWSNDTKYYLETQDNQKFLLRIADIKKHETKEKEFVTLQALNQLDINTSKPLKFGISLNNTFVYTLFSWVAGEEASPQVLEKTAQEQYALGYKAGEILATIHKTLPTNKALNWATYYNQKINKKIKVYNDCAIKFDGSEHVINFIESNRHLLNNRPVTAHHGDYHIGNMLIDDNDKLGIIDFDRFDFGDPWEEFNRITWCADISPHFATGRIDGYFNGDVPDDFFKLLALYIGNNQLSSIPWAIKFGDEQINVMQTQAKKVMKSYKDYSTYIPDWYQPEIRR